MMDIIEKVKQELNILENKGLVALPHFFAEQEIKAIPLETNQCVIAVYLNTLFPEEKFSVVPVTFFQRKETTVKYTFSRVIHIDTGGDLNDFACNFDNHKYPNLER